MVMQWISGTALCPISVQVRRSRRVVTGTIHPLDVTGELVGVEVDGPKAAAGVSVDLVGEVR